MDVLADELGVTLESAGREDVRLLRRRAQPELARHPDECLRQTARVEALPRRARVAGLVPDDRRAERLEPCDPVVQPLPDRALQTLVSGRALRSEVVPLPKAPDDAAREQHRAAGSRPFLVDDGRGAESAGVRGSAEARHPGAGDPQVSANSGLCSTYSIRTRSGPQTKTARVFAASTTLSISTPRSRAAASCSSAESTSTARWLRSGCSGAPGLPGWNSIQAPPTSTLGEPDAPGAVARNPSDPYS